MDDEKEKKKNTNIYEAIKNLPDELITPEIYGAAIREGKVELLNILPEEYLTDDNINAILDNKEANKYSWHTFSLSAIPERCRTAKVCQVAVKNSIENFFDVPPDKLTNEMLVMLMSHAERYLHLMHKIPDNIWSSKAAYKGIDSIYASSESSSSNRRSNSSEKTGQTRLIQIFLSYIPEHIKTQEFYYGLFEHTYMHVDNIDLIVPPKLKKTGYYLRMARKDIKKVPVEKLDYDIMLAGLLSENNFTCEFFHDWNHKSKLQEPMFELMDGIMADVIIRRLPDKISSLPDKFQTKNRLILALDRSDSSRNFRNIYESFDAARFDDDICRAIIRQDSYYCPDFASGIWTQSFVDYCMEHAKSYHWFEKMPKEFQTQQIADIVIGYDLSKIKYVLPRFISYDIAVKAFRYKPSYGKNELTDYVPKLYPEDFVIETGLPEEFFAGLRSYAEVRDDRENYTYCNLGDCYIGFFVDKDGRDDYNRLIMTRRSPMQIKPGIVFSRRVDTFHKTWFEKLVSDNDPQFQKPVPANGTKLYQFNPYYEVRQAESVENQKVFVNAFLGETICYAVKIEGSVHVFSSLESLKSALLETREVTEAVPA